MTIDQRIEAFVRLGTFLSQFHTSETSQKRDSLNNIFYDEFQQLIEQVSIENRWFTPEHVRFSLHGICQFLKTEALHLWIKRYPLPNKNTGKCIAVIMAGNIPMVGFHDMLCVLITGHKFIGKLSSKDNQLLDFVSQILCHIQPAFKELIHFQKEPLINSSNFDAIIATGSNNSARYFESYFKRYPHIIRRNRNSAALITGNETNAQLKALGRDIFLYFGLGCRNVSKLFIPRDYPIKELLNQWESFGDIINHSKYANNYEYNRSIYLMNSIEHLDNGFLLLKEDSGFCSPIGVVFYEYYSDINNIKDHITTERERIQCIVGLEESIPGIIPFGKSQNPKLWDYADDIDTMNFLTKLS